MKQKRSFHQNNSVIDVNNIGDLFQETVERRYISLDSFYSVKSQIPSNFDIKILHPKSDDMYDMCDALGPVVHPLGLEGYGQDTADSLYEAVLNAFQHGNKKDSDKDIKVGTKFNEFSLELMVEDQGSELNENFLPYVSMNLINKAIPSHELKTFYDSFGIKTPEGNYGEGIRRMHELTDEVVYHPSIDGGLIVHLIKNKP